MNGVLTSFDSRDLLDGSYDVQLTVTDTLGLIGRDLTSLIIDNVEPWARVTTPATVTKAEGGDVFTTNAEAHVYFPPGAFAKDVVVSIVQLEPGSVPDTLESGEGWVSPGFGIEWGKVTLDKSATLDLSSDRPGTILPNETTAIFVFRDDTGWEHLGGSVDPSGERIAVPITEAGRYAIFSSAQGLNVGVPLSGLSLTPRVFSPRGTFANDRVAIGFTLERSGPVTVKIYDRAGRLVEEVASGEVMNAGANLIYWNGRNRIGEIVEDGLYMVTVRASDRKETKTLAVVR
jgi:hypothetical protein